MAAKTRAPSVARALRAAVDQLFERRLQRLLRGRELHAEMRELRGALARLERRVDALARRVGAGRRLGARRIGGPGRPPLHEGCRVEHCTSEHYALGLCSRHYQQMRRGRTEHGPHETPPRARGSVRRIEHRGRTRGRPGRTAARPRPRTGATGASADG